MKTQRDKTPDQIAQELLDRRGEWFEPENTDLEGFLLEGAEIDERCFKLAIVDIIERERGLR